MLRIKWISTTPKDFNQYCEELKQRFVNQGYKPEVINRHTKAVGKLDRKELLTAGDNTTSKETEIPLVLTNNRSLQNISKVVGNWNIVLRILTGKKHHKIKLQRLRKIRIWTFGSLVHQINSF